MFKKLTPIVLVAFLAIATPLQSMASLIKTEIVNSADKEAVAARSTILINRMNEIKAMDKSNLNSSEKKELRTELKTMKREMKVMSGGVYLSVGAIIIVILLLILLL